jgi:hypothetical protein
MQIINKIVPPVLLVILLMVTYVNFEKVILYDFFKWEINTAYHSK